MASYSFRCSSSASGLSTVSKQDSEDSSAVRKQPSRDPPDGKDSGKPRPRMAYRSQLIMEDNHILNDMQNIKDMSNEQSIRRSERKRKTIFQNMNEGYIESNPYDFYAQNGVHVRRCRNVDDDGDGPRRSSRSQKKILKKQMYKKMSRSPVKQVAPRKSCGYSLRGSRSSGGADLNQEVENENSKRGGTVKHESDMYSSIKARRSVNLANDNGAVADTEETEELSENDCHNQSREQNEQETSNETETDANETESLSEILESHGPTKYRLRPRRSVAPKPFQMTVNPPRTRRQAHYHHHHRRHYRSQSSRLLQRSRRGRYGDSDSSSSSSSSSDEEHFERRKSEKMMKARSRCLPMNLSEKDILKGTLQDRQKIGSSLADIDPMSIDKSILFDSIGGLDEHLKSLKEMVVFPLLYPEVFAKYKLNPPRGVIFHGPPGTGKTLVARALANECSSNDRKVAFFMRKGADCLSKWVGESERQLRLLFDQAYLMRPSIIFFDEVDGIAPVRSTRQDQIHSSIVSTLLALMDGLDDRGEVIVIGATNRLEAIDPALRRPGRFDREFFFPLPSLSARNRILSIHTKEWQPPLSSNVVNTLAALTAGYCGADLKALCGEAALLALKRRYPQIYKSRQKLLLNTDEIVVKLEDFVAAIKKIVPASQRSVATSARPLSIIVKPLLSAKLTESIEIIRNVFPIVKDINSRNQDCHTSASSMHEEFLRQELASNNCQASDINLHSLEYTGNYRPRLMIHGEKGQGQSTHLGPAILHHFEHLQNIRIDLPALFSVTTRTPEESLSNLFLEAIKRIPSIVYLPRVNQWWSSLSESLRVTLTSLIEDLEPNIPILVLGTSDCDFSELPDDLKEIFDQPRLSVRLMQMTNPSRKEREEFFKPLFKHFVFAEPRKVEFKTTEELPIAPPPEPRKLTEKELKRLRKKENFYLRELRLFLRDVLAKLLRDKRFSIFVKPVDLEEVPDYLEVVETPMSLETMMIKIDTHQYETAEGFLKDIELICSNALEYNPNRDSADKLIRHRACQLQDFAISLIDSEMQSEFEEECKRIEQSRNERGETPSKQAPFNYKTPTTKAIVAESTTEENPPTLHNNDEDTEIETQSADENATGCLQTRKRPAKVQSRQATKKSRSSEECNGDSKSAPVTAVVNGKSGSNVQFPEVAVSIVKLSHQEVKELQGKQEELREKEANEIIIDRKIISGLMEKAVILTNGYPVEQLEELYSSIYRLISDKRDQYNRTSLEKEIAMELDKFERLKKYRRQS